MVGLLKRRQQIVCVRPPSTRLGKEEYRVALVLNQNFGEVPLSELSKRIHVWICGSPENKRATETVWAGQKEPSIEFGVTTFNYDPKEAPEQIVIDRLADIDLHHGEYSHTPPWTALEVIGAKASQEVTEALSEYGAERIETTGAGFVAYRNNQTRAV